MKVRYAIQFCLSDVKYIDKLIYPEKSHFILVKLKQFDRNGGPGWRTLKLFIEKVSLCGFIEKFIRDGDKCQQVVAYADQYDAEDNAYDVVELQFLRKND